MEPFARPRRARIVAAVLDRHGADRVAELARRLRRGRRPTGPDRRPSRTWRGAGGSTRRSSAIRRTASPGGTPWPSARGRPRRNASGTALRGGRSGARTSPGSARRGSTRPGDPVARPARPINDAAAIRPHTAPPAGDRRSSRAGPLPRIGAGSDQVGIVTAAGGRGARATSETDRRRSTAAASRGSSRAGSSDALPDLAGQASHGRRPQLEPGPREGDGVQSRDQGDADLGADQRPDAEPVGDRVEGRVLGRVDRREDHVHVRRTSRSRGSRRRSASAARPRTGSPRARRTGTRSARGRGSARRRRQGR